MNTKFIVFIFICGEISLVFSQKVTGNIEDANVLRTEDGIVVFGIVKESSKKFLSVIRYDNDLKPMAQFKKEMPEELADEVSSNKENDDFVFQCKNGSPFKAKGAFIRLDEKLNMKSYKEYGKDEYKSQLVKGYTPSPDIMTAAQPFIPFYTKGNIFLPSFKYLFSSSISPNELWTSYDNKWKKEIECKKIETNDILLVTNKFVLAYVNDESEKNSFTQYMICLDKNSGDVIYKTQLNPNYQKVIAPSNAAFNDNTGELIIAGNYADIDKKNKIYKLEYGTFPDYWTSLGFNSLVFDINGIFLMKISKDGQIIKSTFEKSTPYKIKNDILPLNKYDIKSVFHKIIQLSNNEFVAIIENICDANWLGLSDDEHAAGGKTYRPFGFSLIYFNNELTITNTKFIEKEDFYKRNGLKNSPIFKSFNLAPLNQYPNYYYSNNDYCTTVKNHYSYTDCTYDEKQKNITLLYNNFIMNKLASGTTTYYAVKINSNGEAITALIPNQQINAKQNSHVFLIDTKKGILFTPLPKESKYKLEIISF